MAPSLRSPRLLALLWLATMPLLGCNPEPVIARNKRAAVTVLEGTAGPRGAQIKSDEVEVDIPAGALGVNTTVSVQKVPRGGSSTASLHLTSLGVTPGCAQLRPQGDYLYVLEPQSLVFAKDVRIGITTPGSADGITALTPEGASTGSNGYAAPGQKASILLRDFSAALDIQTLSPWSGAVYTVTCDASTCTATNSSGQPTTCAPHEPGYYLCQGPLGLPALTAAASTSELKSLMIAVAVGQGATCQAAPPPPTCGNGALDAGEACDGAVPAAQTCATVLAPGATGTLACTGSCTLDTAGCQLPPGCTDSLKNGTETDTDCGGSACPPCADTRACAQPSDCQSGVCTGNVCSPAPTCADSLKNGTETDTDCGGTTCAKCPDTKACLQATDCQSGVCTGSVCSPAPTCADGLKNAQETDTDCGGATCAKCADTKACLVAADCVSNACLNSVCSPAPTCSDALKNSNETDTDCGGSCPACADTKACLLPIDCQSGVCTGNVCSPAPTCTDQQKNGQETGTDCGGPTCAVCADGQPCLVGADCLSNLCTQNVCTAVSQASCSDGLLNGDETAADCGGSCASKCSAGLACLVNADCVSSLCQASLCTSSTCTDAVLNGTESDTDCGGSCTPCADLAVCAQGADCQSGVCTGNTCQPPTCSDSAKNGQETDTDCGGPVCTLCSLGQSCTVAADCASGFCTNLVCALAACANSVKDASETDVDCGGPSCAPCPDSKACLQASDCQSSSCPSGVCQPPGCFDLVQNGGESDVDCGGSCEGCPDGKICTTSTDCFSKQCSSGLCASPSCSDGVANGAESDTDCGGGCAPCAEGEFCLGPADCQSSSCSGGVCAAPSCTDQQKNGQETDLDCGGVCPGCAAGQQCLVGADCATGFCAAGACVSGTRVFLTSQPFLPTFGSALQADAICQSAANAVQLGGTWMAWVGDATTSPALRFTMSPAPYRLLDGTVIANDWADLTDGQLAHAIDLSEVNTVLPSEVWTGTNSDALFSESACSDWTNGTSAVIGTVGLSDSSDGGWSNKYLQFCDRVIRLYCFEQ